MYQLRITLTLLLLFLISISSFAACPINVKGSEAMSMGVYIEDLKTGKVWNPNFLPSRESLDFFESRHGLGSFVCKSINHPNK